MPLPASPPDETRLERVRALARLLDSALPVPGTRWRVGLDGLIGLVPGVGDAAGALLSSYIVLEAARLGAPRSALARMAANVLLEVGIGAVPLLGDLFDFAFKANRRNLRLLERHLSEPERTGRASRAWLAAMAAGAVLVGLGVVALAGWLLAALLGVLGLG